VQKRNEYYLVFDTGATVDAYNLKGKKRKKNQLLQTQFWETLKDLKPLHFSISLDISKYLLNLQPQVCPRFLCLSVLICADRIRVTLRSSRGPIKSEEEGKEVPSLLKNLE
jgi:hypothetical protein